MAKQRTVKEIAAAAKLRETTVVLSFAGDLQGRLEELEHQLAAVSADWSSASLADTDPRAAIAQQMADVRAEMADNEAPFHLRALPAKRWSDLLAAHPPRPGVQEQFDVTTFPAAAIAACCTDPVLTEAEYADLAEHLTAAQEDALFEGVWRINTQGVGAVPFSLAASAILASLTAGS